MSETIARVVLYPIAIISTFGIPAYIVYRTLLDAIPSSPPDIEHCPECSKKGCPRSTLNP